MPEIDKEKQKVSGDIPTSSAFSFLLKRVAFVLVLVLVVIIVGVVFYKVLGGVNNAPTVPAVEL